MRIDNFYFVVSNLKKSIEFYSKLLWADWCIDSKQIYFGIISKDASEDELRIGNNGALGLYTDDINLAYNKCLNLGVKILYDIFSIPNSIDNYKCFAIEDLDGNKIEIASYDK